MKSKMLFSALFAATLAACDMTGVVDEAELDRLRHDTNLLAVTLNGPFPEPIEGKIEGDEIVFADVPVHSIERLRAGFLNPALPDGAAAALNGGGKSRRLPLSALTGLRGNQLRVFSISGKERVYRVEFFQAGFETFTFAGAEIRREVKPAALNGKEKVCLLLRNRSDGEMIWAAGNPGSAKVTLYDGETHVLGFRASYRGKPIGAGKEIYLILRAEERVNLAVSLVMRQ